MAKKRKGPNVSLAIREYYDANPDAKPTEVVEAMKSKGIKTNTGYVSSTRTKQKSETGQTKKRRGRPKGATKMVASKRRTSAGRTPSRRGSSDTLSLDNLLRAKELIDELGGVENARATIDAIEQIST